MKKDLHYFIYRMTHINNVEHIMNFGITHCDSPNKNTDFFSIGDPSLITARNAHVLPNGKTLGEYIPFYFGPRMPMLYVIQKGFNNVAITPPENIVYCVSSVQRIIEANVEFLFTNGHAVDGLTTFYTKEDINNIENIIDKKAINSKFWNNEDDLDLKRRKEAEFLIENDIPKQAIIGWVVYDENAKQILEHAGVNKNIIKVEKNYYF